MCVLSKIDVFNHKFFITGCKYNLLCENVSIVIKLKPELVFIFFYQIHYANNMPFFA